MQENNIHTRQETDEIDLAELWQTLVKKKSIVFATTLMCVATSVAYIFLKVPIYEATAFVEVGQVGQVGQVEPPQNLVQKLQILFTQKESAQENEISTVSLVKNSNNIIEIKAEAQSAQEAKKKLKAVWLLIDKQHSLLVQNYKNINMQKIALLKQEYTQVQKELDDYNSQLGSLKKNTLSPSSVNPSLFAIYIIELNNKNSEINGLKSKIVSLKNQIKDIEISISAINIKETKLIGGITAQKDPVKPKKSLIIVVSFVTGLILGIFMVFLSEFVSNIKNRQEV